MDIKIQNLEDLHEFTKKLSKILNSDDLILLFGDLGTGKTEFTRSLINNLIDTKTEVLSPTFMLLQTYNTLKGELWHYDLYRLERKEDIEEISLFDAIGKKIVIIEWPEIISNFLPEDRLEIKIEIGNDLEERIFKLTPYGNWNNKLREL